MITKNEYIASIMLEAADLLKDDTESLNEVGSDNYFDQILNEAAEFSDIQLLLEASDDIKKIQISINVKNTSKILKNIKSVCNNLLKWYYKVEPNKKFSALRTLIKTINGISYQLQSKLGGGVVNRVANAKDDNVRIVGYILLVVTYLATGVSYLQSKSFALGQYKYNVKDFDDNIKLLKDGYNKLKDKYNSCDDKKVKSGLQKAMNEYQKSINELNKLKVKYDKLKDSNISARGAAIRLNEDKVDSKEAVTAMKEAIDLLYDKAMECDTIDEVTEYINKAEQLESLIDE